MSRRRNKKSSNPLADPGILGVTHGAALAVVLSIFLLGVDSLVGYIWFAFAGAMIASVVVFLLGSAGRGGPSPVTLALAGAAVSALMNGLVSAIVLLDQQSLDAFRFWQVGAIAGRDLTVLTQVATFLCVGLVIAALNAPGLNAMSLGEDVAKSLKKYQDLGINHFILSDTPYREETIRIGDQLLPLLR